MQGEREQLVAFELREGRGRRHGVHGLILYGVSELLALPLEAREDGLAVRAGVCERVPCPGKGILRLQRFDRTDEGREEGVVFVDSGPLPPWPAVRPRHEGSVLIRERREVVDVVCAEYALSEVRFQVVSVLVMAWAVYQGD